MNGINPENGNACTTATASEGSKDSDTIWLDELFLRYWISTLAAAQQAQQMVQPAVDWLSRPRNPMCMAGFAGAGAAVGGFSGGGVGALGFAGGPAGFATTPAFSASGAALGGGIGGLGGMIMCSSGTGGSGSGPKPASNFKSPTNPPQPPPTSVPSGWRVRVMPPTSQYPKGYWRLEKPMPNGGWQGINPSTMKPGPQWETHISLP